MEDFFAIYKKQIFLLGVLIAVILLLTVIQWIKGKGMQNKIVTNKDLVYDNLEQMSSVGENKIPFINFKMDGITEINNEIVNLCLHEIVVEKRNVSYTYDTDNKTYLSVFIHSQGILTNGIPYEDFFFTYNFDLKKKKQITEEELLSNYQITEEEAEEIYEKQLYDWYQETIEEGFSDGYCDFSCYKDAHVKEDNASFVRKDGNLYMYKDFDRSAAMGDETFFEGKDLGVALT